MGKYDFTAQRDDYLTPSEIVQYVLDMNDLEQFDCDVCCFQSNIPAKFRYKKDGLFLDSGAKISDSDGLKGAWFPVNWCNPPFPLCKQFIRKASEEQKRGRTTYMLIPARTETKYWHDYILDGGRASNPTVDVEFLRKGICFLNPDTREKMPVFKNPLALVKFKGYRINA